MKVFISWSGQISMRIAKILYDWLPVVHQNIKPYMSAEIDKGTRWGSSVASELESSNFGLLCMTRENLTAPWIYFESGALAKVVEHSRVAPILFELKPSDIQGPLTQFQAVNLIDQHDMMRLLKSINQAAREESRDDGLLEKAFNALWGLLDENIKSLPKNEPRTNPETPSGGDAQAIMEEILVLVRQQSQMISSPEIVRYIRKQLNEQLDVMRKLLNFIEAEFTIDLIELESALEDIFEKWTGAYAAYTKFVAMVRTEGLITAHQEEMIATTNNMIDLNEYIVRAHERPRRSNLHNTAARVGMLR